jgi:hypothetical protein
MSALIAPNGFRRRDSNFRKVEARLMITAIFRLPLPKGMMVGKPRGRSFDLRRRAFPRWSGCRRLALRVSRDASRLKSGTLLVLPAWSPLGRTGYGLMKDVLTITQSVRFTLPGQAKSAHGYEASAAYSAALTPAETNGFPSTISRSMRRMKLSSCRSADRRRLQLCRGARTWIACRQCAGGAGGGAVVARSSKPRRRSRRRFSWVASVSGALLPLPRLR